MEQKSLTNGTSMEFAAFIGLDWADQKHDLCLCEAGKEELEKSVMEHTPEALAGWVNDLRQRFGGRPVAIALEQSRGGLIAALMNYDFIVLYLLNPSTVDRFRKAFASSGAKDDPTDAEFILEILLKHRDKLKAWKPDEVPTRKLARLVEGRRKIVDLRTQLVQMLTASLKEVFPQALDLVGELATPLACDFLLKWPSLQALQKSSSETIRKFYYGHRLRRGDLIEKRLAMIKQACVLTQDPAILESSALMTESLVKQLRAILTSIALYNQQIDKTFAEHPDGLVFSSLPGAGAVLAPRLLTAFGSDRSRFESAQDIQKLSGIAPITKRSGKSSIVQRRLACPKFIRQSFHEFANLSIRFSGWANLYYEKLRTKGKGHHAAVRSLAFKWIRIIFRCWKNRKPYDEKLYLSTLKKRNSPYQQAV